MYMFDEHTLYNATFNVGIHSFIYITLTLGMKLVLWSIQYILSL